MTVLGVAWVVAAVYATIPSFWLVIHPFSRHWRARHRSPYKIFLLFWLLAILLLLGATAPWRHLRLYATSWALLPAIALALVSLFIYSRAGRSFNFSRLIGRPELDPAPSQTELVATGLHASVRHPIYLGHLCTLTALTIGSGLAVLYVFLAIAVVTGWWMIREEDRELERRFGQEFLEYKKRVPGIVPRW